MRGQQRPCASPCRNWRSICDETRRLNGARQDDEERASGASEQGDEADEAFGGTNVRTASVTRTEVPPHARAVSFGRGHRFAAYPRCSADLWRREPVEANPGVDTALR